MIQKWIDVRGRYIRDPRYGHRLGKSYTASKAKRKPGYQEEIREQSTDQYGFIDNGYQRILPAEFSKDHLGVVILGASTAMGLGATENSKTVAAVIEKNLRNNIRDRKISVINAGCAGYTSWEAMMYFLTELILRKPHLVISISGQVDFSMEYFGSKYYEERIPNTSRSIEDVAEAIKLRSFELSFFELARHKFKKTNFYKKLINFIRSSKGEIKLNDQNFVWGTENFKRKYDSKIISRFWKNQISLLGACKAHNINYHLYIEPCYYWSKRKKLTDKEKAGIEFDRKLFKEYEQKCIKYFEDFVREDKYYLNYFDEKNYIFEYLTKIFDDVEDQCYVDHNHLTNRGQEIVADKITKNILSSKVLDF